jgi:subtilisin family serine protease
MQKNIKLSIVLIGVLLFPLVLSVSSCASQSESEEDPLFRSQWGLFNDGNGKDVDTESAAHDKAEFVTGIDIKAKQMWEKQRTLGENQENEVFVALIDTAVDFSHEDLSGIQWVNKAEVADDGIDNDHNGYIDEINGWDFVADVDISGENIFDEHGTLCAGIIAAKHNGLGIDGIAAFSKVQIMSLSVLSSTGLPIAEGNEEDLVAAINYAESMGADVCNLSLEMDSPSEKLRHAILGSDMLFVVSSGNNDNAIFNINIDKKPVYPASFGFDNAICVTSVGADGKLSSFSNKGNKTVDVAAPGDCIISTGLNNEYHYFSGCSAAVPFVTGVAATLFSINKETSPSDVKDAILSSVVKNDYLIGKIKSEGIIDGATALSILLEKTLG